MLSTAVHLDVCYVILQKQIDSNNVVYQRSCSVFILRKNNNSKVKPLFIDGCSCAVKKCTAVYLLTAE